MRKLIILLIVIAISSPVFAQNNATNTATGVDGDLYYHNVPVERIYSSLEGYIVQYRKGVNQIGTIGVPNAWFTELGRRAEIIKLPSGLDWPSMTVFYENGEFKFVRLYVHRVKGHSTWSVVPQGANVSRFFQNPDSFDIEF